MMTIKFQSQDKVRHNKEKYESKKQKDHIQFLYFFPENKKTALERYKEVCPNDVESFVSCSDDFTLYLWNSDKSKFITRMTGHQNVVNDVKYSPDVK